MKIYPSSRVTQMYSLTRSKAFTLVEVMLVLVILSILISFAFPTYDSVVRKGQRVEGKTLLLEIQSQMERYYFNNKQYPDRLSKLKPYSLDVVDSENEYYQVSLNKPSQTCPLDSCYLLTAKPISGVPQEVLSLYSNGKKEGPW